MNQSNRIFGISDYKDDTEDEFPVSLNTPQMMDGLMTMAMNSPQGDFMEIGVWRGGTASILHQIAEKQSRKLYLFDLFESDNCLKSVRKFCPNAAVFKGKFPDSWPGNINNIAFCLFDYYDPDGARFLTDLMPNIFVKGGILLFSYVFYVHQTLPSDCKFMYCNDTKYPYLIRND